MLTRKQKYFFLKFFSLFSIVRGYNVLAIVVAQYLSAIYILAPELPLKKVLLDINLFIIVLASAVAIASGYIINSFYDSEKDLINRPRKTMLDRLVSQRTKLTAYFVLNFLSVIIASYVSFKAVIFFSLYIFGIWFYSHKIKKYPFIGNLVASTLAVTPFFAVFIYYKNFDLVIFVHATFLFLIIAMREMIKDLENLKGDLAHNYRTIPVVYGIKTSKQLLSILWLLTCVPIYLFFTKFDIGYMVFYFYSSIILLVLFILLLWKASKKSQYILLHNLLKFLIVVGVLSIAFINVNRISL